MKFSITSYIATSAIVIMSALSCVREDHDADVKMEFQASFEVGMLMDVPQLWSSSDIIAVSGASGVFKTSQAFEGEEQAVFSGQTVSAGEYYAAMPFAAFEHFSPSSPSIVSMNLPCVQDAFQGGISGHARLAVAHTESSDAHFIFRSPLAFMKFTIGPQSGKIRSVSVISVSGTRLSGSFSVDCSSVDPYPYPAPASQSNVVLATELDYLSEGDYYIAMLPGEDQGYEIAFEDVDGMIALMDVTTGYIERGEVTDLGLIQGLEFKDWNIRPISATRTFFSADKSEQYLRYHTDREVEASVTMGAEWLSIVRTKAVERGTLHIEAKANTGLQRMGQVVVESTDGTSRITYNILQFGNGASLVDKHKQALIDLYESAGGDQWNRHDNWCTDAPLEDWYGVTTDATGAVTELYLPSNGLKGVLPDNIGDLAGGTYTTLYLNGNQLEGTVPASLMKIFRVNLSDNKLSDFDKPEDLLSCPVYSLVLSRNAFEGALPEWLGELPFLYQLDLSANHFTGGLPQSYADIPGAMYVFDNWLSGRLPQAIIDQDNFIYQWPIILRQYGEGFDTEGLMLPMAEFALTDGTLTPYDVYSSNVYTAIVTHRSASVDSELLKRIALWYDCFHESGFEVICLGSSALPDAYSAYPWYRSSYYPSYWSYVNQFAATTVALVDSDGNMVSNPFAGYEYAQTLLEEAFGPLMEFPAPVPPSAPTVTVIQEAAIGDGIDLVFLGDAFTSEMIAEGLFAKAVDGAVNAFFSIAPVCDFKHYFNIYSVSCPSVSGEYSEDSDTAYDCWWGEDVSVGGNDELCREHTLMATGHDRIDDVLTVVLMNSEQYAGTTYMYSPSSGENCSGWAVSYIPLNDRMNDFRFLIRHEAVGHGFAKLADEYAYQANGLIPQDIVSRIKDKERFGWWKNLDFTNVLSDVKWARFVDDRRYVAEGIGAFEGGYGYWSGVWVPTEESVMRYDSDFFNAPSRYAVWERIGSIAYGTVWAPSFEEFVSYDLDSPRNRSHEITRSSSHEHPLPAPPVVK